MVAAISIDSVSKSFGALRAVSDLSLAIEPGEFFGLLGPNGAGKTTLISMLAGLTCPDSGRLSIMGHDVISDYRAARAALGIVPQELVFDPFFTVIEALRFQSGYYGIVNNDDWIDEIISNLDLADKRDASLRSLSGGMKRRFLIAQALVHRPPVIVLDEPTAGVDVELRQSLWQFVMRLNRAGHTIVLTTHYLEEAEALCSRIALLKEGKIVAMNRTQDLLASFGKSRLKVTVPCGRLPEPLAKWSVRPDGQGWVIDINLYDEIETILSAFRQAGCEITDLEILRPDLENVFIQLMR